MLGGACEREVEGRGKEGVLGGGEGWDGMGMVM